MLISELSFAHCGSKTVKQSMIPSQDTLQFPPFLDATSGIFTGCLTSPHLVANFKSYSPFAIEILRYGTLASHAVVFRGLVVSMCYWISYRKFLSPKVMLISDLSFAHCGSKTVKQSMIPSPGTLQFPPFYMPLMAFSRDA